jgi:hypothetical protein
VRVGAGQVEGQPGRGRLLARPGLRQRVVERGQVGLVGAAIGQLHVQVARFLAEGEVLRAVQREREHGRVVAEDRRRAVALVHVQVDDEHPQQRAVLAVPLGLHQPRGHRHVVEDAVARALVA